jgi:hypothetical protein
MKEFHQKSLKNGGFNWHQIISLPGATMCLGPALLSQAWAVFLLYNTFLVSGTYGIWVMNI